MKSQKLFSAGLLLLVAALLASCSTSIDIVKRQFNDGYYVNISKKKSSAKAPGQTLVTPDENTIAQVTQTPAVAEEESARKEESPVRKNESASPAQAPAEKASNEKDNFKIAVASDELSYEAENQNTEMNSPSFTAPTSLLGGSVPTIIMILLCLFLPFIAVGIVDDWRTRFLISILLTLLFWIPGVIYAFIVCFS